MMLTISSSIGYDVAFNVALFVSKLIPRAIVCKRLIPTTFTSGHPLGLPFSIGVGHLSFESTMPSRHYPSDSPGVNLDTLFGVGAFVR
jgi:hypothetical protein